MKILSNFVTMRVEYQKLNNTTLKNGQITASTFLFCTVSIVLFISYLCQHLLSIKFSSLYSRKVYNAFETKTKKKRIDRKFILFFFVETIFFRHHNHHHYHDHQYIGTRVCLISWKLVLILEQDLFIFTIIIIIFFNSIDLQRFDSILKQSRYLKSKINKANKKFF